ncbi:hypothetical protein QCA50_001730 [Cerrena zonata]|uniref:Alginate lyase domain-containing protein n=1 Tax=Cerrena zonata TaxID=2478898 RepID=A0AAW0GRT5_9APHY
MSFSTLRVLAVLAVVKAGLAAEPNDWVNVDYVLKHVGDGATAQAQNTIVSKAGSTAQEGPWTVLPKAGIKPPSGDIHDYLSWAPYHWPNCNWCGKGSQQIANPNGTRPDNGEDNGYSPYEDQDPYEDDNGSAIQGRSNVHQSPHSDYGFHRGMRRVRRSILGHYEVRDIDVPVPIIDDPPASVPVPPPSVPGTKTSHAPTSTKGQAPAATAAPAQNASKPKNSGKDSKCTPSPTKSLAPSATWTTCPYVVRDGQVNPDVRNLPGSQAAQNMPQSVLFNTLAYAFQKSSANSKNVAKFIDAFFLTSSTGMNPNMNFGQQVRGPGADHQKGTFTGPLDMRALVKIVNSIQILKALKSPDWTTARDQAFMKWMKTYVNWLKTSDIGKELAGKANNHFSFYVSQLSAAQIYIGDTDGAAKTVKDYFNNQFKDQIAQSGEQPFEAVRTRPYHYRAFNLEAVITNAKIADQLGFDVWTSKSKYGATIQTAVDYAMKQDPDGEEVSDLIAHVAAVAAAYGDPKGKYKAFLQKNKSNYQSQSFWFYDQTDALPNSPAAASKHKRDAGDALTQGTNDTMVGAEGMVASMEGIIPFECPTVFANDAEKQVEIEDGLFVTCDQLAPYYKLPVLSDM